MQKLPKFVLKQTIELANVADDKNNKLEQVITLEYFLMSDMFFQ